MRYERTHKNKCMDDFDEEQKQKRKKAKPEKECEKTVKIVEC